MGGVVSQLDPTFAPVYSPSEQLPAEVVPFSNRNIVKIEVRAYYLINSTKFTYTDGTSMVHGQDGGGLDQPTFHLAPNEYILKVHWRQSSQLCGIQFETNTNRRSIPYLLTNQAIQWQNANTGPGRYWVHSATPGYKVMGYRSRLLPGQFNCPCKYIVTLLDLSSC